MIHPDEVRMTFGEHLEELRGRLIRSLLAFVVAAVVCLSFQGRLFEFFLQPYLRAERSLVERGVKKRPYGERKLGAVLERLAEKGLWSPEDEAAVLAEVGPAPVVEPISAIGVTESFLTHLKIALLTALLASSPVLLHQLWRFVAAGLYDKERRAVLRVFPFSLAMFAAGMVFGFLVLVPISLDFLLGYGDPELLSPAVTVSSYTSLLFVLLFVMGLVFQIPLIMTVVVSVGIVPAKWFREKRRVFLLVAVVLGAILTPPDYVTQLLVAAPMVLLYELGIWMAAMAEWRRQKPAAGGTS